MLYPYQCQKCKSRADLEYRMGQAPRTVACPKCGAEAKRVYEGMSFILRGNDWPSKSGRFKREMTGRNERAGERMRKEHTPGMNLVAHDFGNGDVREVDGG